jgi:5-methylcytosine-specific restriction endonuclease McrA
MWQENPHCYYCGVLTIWVTRSGGKAKSNEATIEHLRSRYHKDRREPAGKNERRLVLACYKCNHEKNEEEQKSVPIEERRRRSENHRVA